MPDAEIQANAEAFRSSLSTEIATNIASHKATELEKIDASYARLTILQAFRSHILTDLEDGAMGFFTEAQSDGLSSQVLISAGMGRSALKSLRSISENVVRSIYYADHIVEYRLWEMEKHRPTFSSLFDYIDSHPDIRDLPDGINPSSGLRSSWKSLSNAVHASLKSIRTTKKVAEVNLWRTDKASVGQWNKAQSKLMEEVSLLYVALYRDRLSGAKATPVRKALSHTIKPAKDGEIKSSLGVNIIR